MVQCEICPHRCTLAAGQLGLCRARGNVKGSVSDLNYGRLTSVALDPVEKKPLARFYPGAMILSAGSYGCNFRCGFCQNHSISMCGPEAETQYCAPADLVELAEQLRPRGNIGIAYTYNEPFVGYEYVRDTSRLVHEKGMQNVVVTNGYINQEPLRNILPLIDAMNIDLKAFSEEFYRSIGGSLEPVKDTIQSCAASPCHVEVTTLVVPGRNDSEEEIGALSTWLASVDPDIPLHLTRFFPRYKMRETRPTDVEHLLHLTEVARRHLRYVYPGNV